MGHSDVGRSLVKVGGCINTTAMWLGGINHLKIRVIICNPPDYPRVRFISLVEQGCSLRVATNLLVECSTLDPYSVCCMNLFIAFPGKNTKTGVASLH